MARTTNSTSFQPLWWTFCLLQRSEIPLASGFTLSLSTHTLLYHN